MPDNNGHKDETVINDPLRISLGWARVMYYARTRLPHGEITIQIHAGEPGNLIDKKEEFRFDKPDYFPEVTLDKITLPNKMIKKRVKA